MFKYIDILRHLYNIYTSLSLSCARNSLYILTLLHSNTAKDINQNILYHCISMQYWSIPKSGERVTKVLSTHARCDLQANIHIFCRWTFLGHLVCSHSLKSFLFLVEHLLLVLPVWKVYWSPRTAAETKLYI